MGFISETGRQLFKLCFEWRKGSCLFSFCARLLPSHGSRQHVISLAAFIQSLSCLINFKCLPLLVPTLVPTSPSAVLCYFCRSLLSAHIRTTFYPYLSPFPRGPSTLSPCLPFPQAPLNSTSFRPRHPFGSCFKAVFFFCVVFFCFLSQFCPPLRLSILPILGEGHVRFW